MNVQIVNSMFKAVYIMLGFTLDNIHNKRLIHSKSKVEHDLLAFQFQL